MNRRDREKTGNVKAVLTMQVIKAGIRKLKEEGRTASEKGRPSDTILMRRISGLEKSSRRVA